VGVEVGVEIAAQNNYDIDLGLSILYLLIYITMMKMSG
jgi:hypothetical protein